MEEEQNNMEKYRYFLKDHIRMKVDFSKTDQNKGVEPPPLEKPFSGKKKLVELPGPDNWKNINDPGIIAAIKKRRSRRKYSNASLDIEELSFLLWATQGVKKKLGKIVFRNVPSAGNRHAFETYLCIMNVMDLEIGIYRYLPLEHAIILEQGPFEKKDISQRISNAALGQYFVGNAVVVFIWSVIPYRTEWRYGKASHKVIAIDAGHVCQNLYTACEAISCGTCAIAAYDQDLMDEIIKVDGEEEFVIYMAPVGKV